jgi:cation diffusion facilitator family transporter
MIKLLTKLFVKNSEDVKNPEVRAAYGNMSGIVGIFLNLCLFAAKLVAGVLSSSISVTADAFNNLSDAGSSVVTFLGFKLASKPADKEHPFGHGRYEYVAGLGISVFILLVGFELIKSSFEKIINPEAQTSITLISIVILIASVCVKFWMFCFNKILLKKINSSALNATAIDSLTDCIATTIVLLGLVISNYFNITIDGYLGVAVSIFIFIAGVNTFKDSLSPLLGNPPEQEFVDEIKQTVLSYEIVVGIHDMIVHDYGPGRCIISLHAEVPCDEDILKAHDAIDLIEKELGKKFNCMATIHMDPVATDDEYTLDLKVKVADKMCEINPEFSIHDFRIVQGQTHTNVIFDLVIPHSCKADTYNLQKIANAKIAEIDSKLIAVMHIEKSFIE